MPYAMSDLIVPINSRARNLNKKIGLKIRLARVANGLKQKDLAKHLQVCQRTISSYENGTNGVDAIALFKIAKFLKQNVDYFSPLE